MYAWDSPLTSHVIEKANFRRLSISLIGITRANILYLGDEHFLSTAFHGGKYFHNMVASRNHRDDKFDADVGLLKH